MALTLGDVAGTSLCWVGFHTASAPGCEYPGSVGIGGTAPTLGKPLEHSLGSHHRYNFTVQAVGRGLTLGQAGFAVESYNGTKVLPSPDWILTALSASGENLGNYSFEGASAGGWPADGSIVADPSDVFSLLSVPDGLSGDTLLWTVPLGDYCPPGTVNTATP